MNYYDRHLGDYARDTGHLSMLEHGAYNLLLDRYYATEAPIPAAQVYRIARATSKQERAAVDAVLAEFFRLVDGSWINRRADEEVERFKASEPERAARRDAANERVRRHRERRAALFDALREHGEVPHYNTATEALEALLKRVTSQPVTRYATASRHQTPDTTSALGESLASTEGLERASAAGRACLAMRKAGCVQVNPSHPDLLAALAEGVTADELADAVREGLSRSPPVTKPFAWAITTTRSRRAAGPRPIATTGASPHETRAPSRRLSAVEQVQQAIHERRARDGDGQPPAAA